jgi:NAD-dependent deacetylase
VSDRLALHEHVHGDDVEPNPARAALAELEAADYLDALVTQNTDGLHNFERTPVSERAEYDFRADVTDVLPRVAGAL